MKYYRIYLKNRVIDYAYSIEQLKEVIAYNKVDYIELCEDNKILKVYNSLEEVIKESD
ncbi:MAG: hypothetical protein MSA15_19780 [Clostridium sp.]|nr:hypothetical protein [Clostridium sp.]